MVTTQNTMDRMHCIRRINRVTLRGLVVVGGVVAVAAGAQAGMTHPGPGSAVTELRRVSATVVDDARLVPDDPEILLGLGTPGVSFRDFLAHSNNTRYVSDGSGIVGVPLDSQWDPGDRRIGLFVDAGATTAAPTVGTIPAPGALWLLALGTLRTRRRRRR